MRWLEQYWYGVSPLHLLLWPLSVLFALVTALRRLLYRLGVLRTIRLPVPVIVVGNINVGGTGKTPLTIWLTLFLRNAHFCPGIVSRGYLSSERKPRQARFDADAHAVGDEAVLLARRTGAPMWIGVNRPAAAQALLQAHPECNVIISDDGLQHYALARDLEIVTIDGERGFGNGMLLPAGPLRELPWRLARVDALVVNGPALFPRDLLPPEPVAFDMNLKGEGFFNLLDPHRRAGPGQFARHTIHAVAAIGNPHHFFNHLQLLGMNIVAHPFPDHHEFTPIDFAFSGDYVIIMTEKDAVKCAKFCTPHFWVLHVDADVDAGLGELILRKLTAKTDGP